MSGYLKEIARRDNRVVRVADFPGRDAGPELRRLARCGALLRLAHGYYGLVPEESRGPQTSWRPGVEAVALGIASADYGRERVALLGPSAARLHGCYPRSLACAVVATPIQRPLKETLVGSIKFVLRDASSLDLVCCETEFGPGWMTSIEQTLLDLSVNWPVWPVSEATRMEMIRVLAARASIELLHTIAESSRGGAALGRLQEWIDDLR